MISKEEMMKVEAMTNKIKYAVVIVEEPDKLLRVVEAMPDQEILYSKVIWDTRTQGDVPIELMVKAKNEDAQREKNKQDAMEQKKNDLKQAANVLKNSNSPETQAFISILKSYNIDIGAL